MSDTRLCRIAYLVDDAEEHTRRMHDVLGFSFRSVDVGEVPLKVRIDEHGFEAMESTGFSFAPIEGRFIEVALAVDDAEVCRREMEAMGVEVLFPNRIPETGNDEYLFKPDFHGLPLMVAFEGDQEAMLAPFETLEDASLPKLGCCAVLVDDLDAAAADFGRIYGMEFTPTGAQRFGRRAAVGRHRLMLVERGENALADQFLGVCAALWVMVDDVEAQRTKMEAAGFDVLHSRAFASGRKAYYFGSQIEGLPLGIYAAADDAEMRGAGG